MKVWITRIVKSKTLIFALLLSSLGALQASAELFTTFMSPKSAGILTIVVGMLVAVLRVITTQPLKDK